MEKPTRLLLACSLAFAARAAPVSPPEPQLEEERPGLLDRAQVSPEKARKLALERVPGKIQKQELEEEDGKLQYSFEIGASPRAADSDTVEVDAMTGQIISVDPDDPFD